MYQSFFKILNIFNEIIQKIIENDKSEKERENKK